MSQSQIKKPDGGRSTIKEREAGDLDKGTVKNVQQNADIVQLEHRDRPGGVQKK